MKRTTFTTFGAMILAAACVGCGEKPIEIASVEGTITMDGNPLPEAAVIFIPEMGRPAGAVTDENGHYVLTFSRNRKGAMLGLNRVKITTLADPWEDDDGNMIAGSPETVPMQYNANTELEFIVEQKLNIANFDISSEGELPEVEEEDY